MKIVPMCQGKFQVYRDAQTGEQRVRNPFHGPVPVVGTSQLAPGSAAGNSQPLTLPRLKQRVQTAGRAGGAP